MILQELAKSATRKSIIISFIISTVTFTILLINLYKNTQLILPNENSTLAFSIVFFVFITNLTTYKVMQYRINKIDQEIIDVKESEKLFQKAINKKQS